MSDGKHITRITRVGLSIWFICAFFYALEYFVRSSTGALKTDFGLAPYGFDDLNIALFSSSFYWSYVLSQIPAGILVDKFGIKRVMMWSTFIFSIAMFVASEFTSLKMLTLYRILAGFGGGFAFLCALKSVSIWLPKRMFSMFTGFTQLLLYTGAILSAAPLVYIGNFCSIQTIMKGIFIVSLLLLLASILLIKTHYLYKKEDFKIGEDDDCGVLEGSSTLDAIKDVLTNKQIWLNGFYCFTIYGTTALFADLWGIHYLDLAGYSEKQASIATSMIFFGVAFCSPLWGIASSIFFRNRIFLLVAPIFGIFVVITVLYIPMEPILLYVLCFVFGGVQSVHVLNYAALRMQVRVTEIATGLAIVNLFLPLSGGVLQPVTGFFIEYLSSTSSELIAYKITLIIIPILMFLSFVISLFIKDSTHIQDRN